jgi:hypothetical protein
MSCRWLARDVAAVTTLALTTRRPSSPCAAAGRSTGLRALSVRWWLGSGIVRIVVIGGSGHVGSFLVPRLARVGQPVVNLARGVRAPYVDDEA